MAAAVTGLDALTSAEAQLQRLMLAFQSKEQSVPVETRPNNVTVTYDFETLTASFTAANLPVTFTQVGADLTITAGTYPSLP